MKRADLVQMYTPMRAQYNIVRSQLAADGFSLDTKFTPISERRGSFSRSEKVTMTKPLTIVNEVK